jgi:thiamine kinase-like enzyme
MKISQLKLREDFYVINNQTLEKYFTMKNGTKYALEINNNKVSNNNLYVYPKINAIISKYPDNSVKRFIYREFDIDANILKKNLAKFYTKLLLNSNSIFAEKRINIKPALDEINSILIFPCNRKIRIFYFNKGYVDIILKNGFSDYFLNREIKFRQEHSELPFIIHITKTFVNGYRENIIKGRALARISDKKVFNKIMSDTLILLNTLQNIDNINIEISKYINTLKDKISTKIDKIKYKFENKALLASLKEFINILINEKYVTINQIPLCLSHGDLQSGNVWIRDIDDKIYIIDWETWGKRSVWYDQFVLILNLRKSNSLLPNLNNYINKGLKMNFIDSISNERTIGIRQRDRRKEIVKMFLLEDILWHLEDTENLPDKIISFGLQFYLDQKNKKLLKQLL